LLYSPAYMIIEPTAQVVELSVTVSPPNIITAVVSKKAVILAKQEMQGQEFFVVYNITGDCGDYKTGVGVSVTLNLFFGWSNNFTATWIQTCYGPDTIHTESSYSDWSTTAIVFFTIMCVSIVFCLTGSAWNYFMKDKIGLEVIPFYDWYQDFYRKCLFFKEEPQDTQLGFPTADKKNTTEDATPFVPNGRSSDNNNESSSLDGRVKRPGSRVNNSKRYGPQIEYESYQSEL